MYYGSRQLTNVQLFTHLPFWATKPQRNNPGFGADDSFQPHCGPAGRNSSFPAQSHVGPSLAFNSGGSFGGAGDLSSARMTLTERSPISRIDPTERLFIFF